MMPITIRTNVIMTNITKSMFHWQYCELYEMVYEKMMIEHTLQNKMTIEQMPVEQMLSKQMEIEEMS